MTDQLPPHHYPIWIKAFTGAVLSITIYALYLLPPYIHAAKNLSRAQQAYQAQNFTESIAFYQSVLHTIPQSKSARIGGAETAFSDKDLSNDEWAMDLLTGLNLDKENWDRLSKVIPPDYQKYFEEVKN